MTNEEIEEEFEEIAAWLEFCQLNTRKEAERLAREIVEHAAAIPPPD